MRHFRQFIKQGIVVLAVFMTGNTFAEGTDPEALEALAVKNQMRLDSMESVRAKLLIQAESLAKRMDEIRGKEPLSAGEHRLLEKQMQQSQLLENGMREINDQEKNLWSGHRPILEKLIQSYQAEIEDLVLLMEKENRADEKETLLSRFNDSLRKKEMWETKLLEPEGESGSPVDVAIKPWDTPRNLMMKGSLLMDQGDVLRKEIRGIDNRLRSLKKEERVRKKAEELAVGMRMFDEREELLGRAAPIDQTGTFNVRGNDPLKNNFGNQNYAMGPSSYGAEESTDRLLADNLSPTFYRSLSDLQDFIEQLQIEKKRLQIRADSLQSKAQRFYRAAEEMKK
jgi:hypothetical protein